MDLLGIYQVAQQESNASALGDISGNWRTVIGEAIVSPTLLPLNKAHFQFNVLITVLNRADSRRSVTVLVTHILATNYRDLFPTSIPAAGFVKKGLGQSAGFLVSSSMSCDVIVK